MSGLRIVSCSPLETEQLGSQLGRLLPPGSFLALRGGLGGGKTCFTRGLVAGAAPDSAHLVASPTFAIMNSYPGPIPVYHFDFYRVSGDDDIAELGFEEFFYADGICIVEWSERLNELLPTDRLTLEFDYREGEQRSITISASGPGSARVLDQLSKQRPKQDFL